MLILERLGRMHSPGIEGVDLDSKATVQGGQGQTFGIIKKNLWKRGGRLRNPAIRSHNLARFFYLSQAQCADCDIKPIIDKHCWSFVLLLLSFVTLECNKSIYYTHNDSWLTVNSEI